MPNWRPNPRTALAILHDLTAAAVAWAVAFWLRFNLDLPPQYFHIMLRTMLLVLGVQAAIFWIFGLYRGIWRYASLHDLRVILTAVGLGALAVPALFVLLRVADPVPRSVFLLDPLLLVFLMGGSRLAYRAWKEGRVASIKREDGTPVLILGGGDSADALIRDLTGKHKWHAVGLLDDNAARQGRQIHGVPVRGVLADVKKVADDLDVHHAVIAMPSVAHAVRRRAVELATGAGLKVMTVPSFDDIVSGKVTVSQLREVELDDLLGRDPVVLDSAGLKDLLSGRSVMVTGAGGSIGAELCRQIARFAPSRLILFELSEFALYQIEQEFSRDHPEVEIVCAVGDVRNRARMERILKEYRPHVLFHAAAYKHVPLMEQVNAWEALQNNVMGTQVAAAAAANAGVSCFVLISTDKAVNPVNVMGASKRLAEMVCQAWQAQTSTRFIMVRFGNVLGSAGSVIPKFRQQIESGGPVTVTHPEITRYFMSIPEAAQLVLQAGAMGRGGEIFVLDMGEPVRIVDLARDMIRLSGYAESDIRIVFTGLRPGEKLYEEVLADDEQTLPTPHPKLRIARARDASASWLSELSEWLAGRALSDDEVRMALRSWVPEYAPDSAGETLDSTQGAREPSVNSTS
ncbi:MAG TPA: nucleoside-diphosphate sugar epimerase/dehydratase [Burkholderiales bacterium]|nr:nucleoside-diphosphate sugar epimerase/dehydratase [Burkholderiales bacterium]